MKIQKNAFGTPKVFIIIPCYNEGGVLKSVLESLIPLGNPLVAVDDGSKDDTWEIIQALPVYGLRHSVNLGQGAALQTGMSFALSRGADLIVHFDADGQHQPQEIPQFVQPLLEGKAEAVLGSRFLRKQDAAKVPLAKRVLLRGAILVNHLLTGLSLSDAHNGFRAFTREAAAKIMLRENRYAHATEIIQQIRAQPIRYIEMPTEIHYSKYSLAKGQSFWNSFNILIDLFLKGMFR